MTGTGALTYLQAALARNEDLARNEHLCEYIYRPSVTFTRHAI